jgi:hypothetical protein
VVELEELRPHGEREQPEHFKDVVEYVLAF